jgi:hypothetical protein
MYGNCTNLTQFDTQIHSITAQSRRHEKAPLSHGAPKRPLRGERNGSPINVDGQEKTGRPFWLCVQVISEQKVANLFPSGGATTLAPTGESRAAGWMDRFRRWKKKLEKRLRRGGAANTGHTLLVQQIPARLYIRPTNTRAYLRLIVTQQAVSWSASP